MKQFKREVEERIARREAMKTLKAQQRYGLNKPEITDIARLKKSFQLTSTQCGSTTSGEFKARRD